MLPVATFGYHLAQTLLMAYKNKYISNTLTGQSYRFVRTARDTNGKLLEMESTFRPGSTEPPAHYHPHQTEDFTMLVGELTVRVEGQLINLRAGDTLRVPPNTVHSMWNASDTLATVNWQVKPALETEFFFETITGLVNEGNVRPNGMPPLLQLTLIANHFSSVFRLAKPSYALQRAFFGIIAPIARLVGYRATYDRYLN